METAGDILERIVENKYLYIPIFCALFVLLLLLMWYQLRFLPSHPQPPEPFVVNHPLMAKSLFMGICAGVAYYTRSIPQVAFMPAIFACAGFISLVFSGLDKLFL